MMSKGFVCVLFLFLCVDLLFVVFIEPSVLRGPVCRKTIFQMSRHLSLCCLCPWFCLCPCLCGHSKLGKMSFLHCCWRAHQAGTELKELSVVPGHFACSFSSQTQQDTDTLSLSIGERKVGCQTRVRGGEGPRVAKPKAASKEDDRLTAFYGRSFLTLEPLPRVSAGLVCTYFRALRKAQKSYKRKKKKKEQEQDIFWRLQDLLTIFVAKVPHEKNCGKMD